MSWLPNSLTLARMVLLVPVILLLEWAPGLGGADRWAFGLFLVAALTDLVDGWAARRLGCVTHLGAFLDPLADKLIANCLLVYLACRFPLWVPWWPVLLLLAREFAVQGFRSMAPCVGVMLRTGQLNKLKTFFQLVAVGAVLAGRGWPDLAAIAGPLALGSLALALAAAYVSMVQLFLRNRDLWTRRPLDLELR